MAEIVAVALVYYEDDPDKKIFRHITQFDFDDADELVDIIHVSNVGPRAVIMEVWPPGHKRLVSFRPGALDNPPTRNGLTFDGKPWPPLPPEKEE